MKWALAVWLSLLSGVVYSQDVSPASTGLVGGNPEQTEVITALREQREEAQDKLARAYVVIARLQREVDRLKAEAAKNKNDAPATK